MASNRLKSLRRSLWGDDEIRPQEVGEALRDLWTAFRGQTVVTPVVLENFVWVVPFFIAHDRIPAAVILGRAKLAQLPGSAAGGFVGWTWTTQGIQIDSASGLTVGTTYDLAFVVIG